MSLPKPSINFGALLADTVTLPYPPSSDGLPITVLGAERGALTGWSSEDHRGSVRGFGEIALRLFDLKLRGIEVRLFEYSVLIEVSSEVPDRDNGAPLVITFSEDWPRPFWDRSLENRAEALRRTLRAWLLHELDENIYVAGKRYFDPHRNPST